MKDAAETHERRATDERRLLRQDIADVDRRIGTWQELYETGGAGVDVVLPRLRELRAKRDELMTALEKVSAWTPPPKDIDGPASIDEFMAFMKDVFVSADGPTTKGYMRFLVDRIEVDGDNITIFPCDEAALALLAEAKKGGLDRERQPDPSVATPARGWLQLLDSNQRPGG